MPKTVCAAILMEVSVPSQLFLSEGPQPWAHGALLA